MTGVQTTNIFVFVYANCVNYISFANGSWVETLGGRLCEYSEQDKL